MMATHVGMPGIHSSQGHQSGTQVSFILLVFHAVLHASQSGTEVQKNYNKFDISQDLKERATKHSLHLWPGPCVPPQEIHELHLEKGSPRSSAQESELASPASGPQYLLGCGPGTALSWQGNSASLFCLLPGHPHSQLWFCSYPEKKSSLGWNIGDHKGQRPFLYTWQTSHPDA